MKSQPFILRTWTPLQDMALAEEKYAERLGLRTYHSKWGVGQLSYLDLDWRDIDRFIDFERMNWDTTFAMDFASLASILNTNMVPCRSWEEVKRILDVYQESWKTRFVTSLFCEGISKVGYLGMPLYYSELVGYKTGVVYRKEGLLEVLEKNPEIGFQWMVLRVIDKVSDHETRRQLLGMMDSKQRNLVYPFLVFGSTAWASFRKLEKMGGKDAVISKGVPEEVRDEVYMMLISTTSFLFDFGPTPKLFAYDDLFSEIHIREIAYFGGDTSMRTSPHFAALRAEIGHLVSTPSGRLLELGDALLRFRQQFGAADRELTFDRVADSSPPEMAAFVSLHDRQKKREKENARFTISPEWLRRLRTEDL